MPIPFTLYSAKYTVVANPRQGPGFAPALPRLWSLCWRYSTLILASRITLPHFAESLGCGRRIAPASWRSSR